MTKDANTLQDLIEALKIFAKYGNPKYPTHCEHDIMYVRINAESVSDEDKAELDKLGFFVNTECGDNCFSTYRFGSS